MKCKFAGGMRVNGLALFKHDREHGLTQMQKAREMFEGVRENQTRKGGQTMASKDITAVRGKKSATQVYRNGGWESK